MTSRPQWNDWIFATLREAAWAPLSILGSYLLALAFYLFKLFPPLNIPFHFPGGMILAYFYSSVIKNSRDSAARCPFQFKFFLHSPAQRPPRSLGSFTKIFWISSWAHMLYTGCETQSRICSSVCWARSFSQYFIDTVN
jgi:hypothetical protein